METPRYASCEFAMVEYYEVAVGIFMIYVNSYSYGDISSSSNLTAIFDFWYTSMSYDIGNIITKQRDPKM